MRPIPRGVCDGLGAEFPHSLQESNGFVPDVQGEGQVLTSTAEMGWRAYVSRTVEANVLESPRYLTPPAPESMNS